MTVLVVAAHPDDEILGVGGVIARHVDDGEAVHILILAEGAAARGDKEAAKGHKAAIAALRDSARAAAGVLGAQEPQFSGLPDNRLDGIELLDVIKIVEAAVADVRPQVVYTHHGGDLNVDHRITHQATVTACRPLPDSSVRAIYSFETLSSTEWASAATGSVFHPTRFVDIAAQLDRKREALSCYSSEMRAFPHPRSDDAVEALARLRGATAGIAAAEAFEVVRELVD